MPAAVEVVHRLHGHEHDEFLPDLVFGAGQLQPQLHRRRVIISSST